MSEQPVEIEAADKYMPAMLKCPSCGGTNLHQGHVKVYSRDAEDGPGTVVTVDGLIAHTARVSARDIPGRRESLQISFFCEECDGDPSRWDKWSMVLEIRQHKGATYLSWWRKGERIR